MVPDFLAVGHVARDLTPDGPTWGGTVTYGALTAQRLGLSPAVVTSADPDLELPFRRWDIPFHNVPAPATTVFRNVYERGRRTQFVDAVAGKIAPADVPEGWRSAPMVLVGPLVGEVADDLLSYFPGSTAVASIQGWLRTWDERGAVTAAAWDGADILHNVDAAVLSEDDAADAAQIDRWAEVATMLIVTMGDRGARLHTEGCWHDVPAFKAEERDPTGAGDVFAAAYLVKYHESRDALEASRFASCAAALSVEGVGTTAIPTRTEVEARLTRP